MDRPYYVHAFWDNEAKVWVASSDEVPGLATEADTSEELIQKLKTLIPELLVEGTRGQVLYCNIWGAEHGFLADSPNVGFKSTIDPLRCLV